MSHKSLQKLIRDRKLLKLRRIVVVFVLISVFLFYKFNSSFYDLNSSESNNSCSSFDVVYTWVNGSDPQLINSIRNYDRNFDPARFDDKNELKYSLRSLQKFAPWLRNVYIVTNGQIPHWLDLSNKRVRVIAHSQLAPNPSDTLPTFSSSSIETFIHRIPGLSRKFLYLNDDIFLGSPLYPEDLFTESNGVRIYTAWTVPDCSADCPWVYIGDGACDVHCNIEECQFDGGDCLEENEVLKKPLKKKPRSKRFKDVINRTNFTNKQHLQQVIAEFNKDLKSNTKTKPVMLPKKEDTKSETKSTKDVYSQSLVVTNKLLNSVYGFKSRNVLGHVGFLLDKDIITEMQTKFAEQIEATASHRFRQPTDLQFAFLYYNFIISETHNLSLGEIFDEFDTDKSSTWSDREIRTFLARLYPLPLDWSAVRYFEDVVTNCSEKMGTGREAGQKYTTLVYERYEDSNIPTVTKPLVSNCEVLAEGLLTNFAQRPKYKYSINSPRGVHSNFMMLTSNVTEIVESLDRFRRNPKKFNCINDNLDPQFPDDNLLIKHILEDFYLSFFPQRSEFELPESYRNRFVNLDDYNRWKDRKWLVLLFAYGISAILVVFLMKSCCCHKAKYVRRYIHSL